MNNSTEVVRKDKAATGDKGGSYKQKNITHIIHQDWRVPWCKQWLMISTRIETVGVALKGGIHTKRERKYTSCFLLERI